VRAFALEANFCAFNTMHRALSSVSQRRGRRTDSLSLAPQQQQQQQQHNHENFNPRGKGEGKEEKPRRAIHFCFPPPIITTRLHGGTQAPAVEHRLSSLHV
jgi:hypothetical protein